MADKPSDIHSVRKLGKELDQFEQLKTALPVFNPFLATCRSGFIEDRGSVERYGEGQKRV